MGMVAILVMWPKPFEHIFVSHPIEAPYAIWLWLVQEKMFKGCGLRVSMMDLSYKLTNEPSAQVS